MTYNSLQKYFKKLWGLLGHQAVLLMQGKHHLCCAVASAPRSFKNFNIVSMEKKIMGTLKMFGGCFQLCPWITPNRCSGDQAAQGWNQVISVSPGTSAPIVSLRFWKKYVKEYFVSSGASGALQLTSHCVLGKSPNYNTRKDFLINQVITIFWFLSQYYEHYLKRNLIP